MTEARAGLTTALAGTASYGAVVGALSAARLVALPFVTRAVPLETFAAYALTVVAMPFVVVLCDLGTGDAMVRFAAADPSPARRRELAATLIASRVTTSLAVGGAAFFGLSLLAERWGWSAEAEWAIGLGVIAAGADAVAGALTDVLRARRRHRAAAAVIGIGGISTTAALLVAAHMDGSLPWLVGAHVLGASLSVLAGLAVTHAELRARPDAAAWRRMLRYGTPLAASSLGELGLNADRFGVQRWLSLSQVGVYHLAAVPSFLLPLASRAVRLAFEPWLFGASREDAAARFDPAFRTFAFVVTAIAMTMAAVAPELVQLLGPPEYAAAVTLVPFFAFAEAGHAMFRFLGLAVGLVEKTWILSMAALLELTAFAALALASAPAFGLEGLGASRLIAACAALVACHGLLRRFWRARLSSVRVLGLLLAAAGISTWALSTYTPAPWTSLGWRLSALLVALLIASLVLHPTTPGLRALLSRRRAGRGGR